MECTPLRISSCEWFAHQDWVEGYLVQLHQLELDSLDNHLLENDLKKEMTGTIKSLIIGIQFCQSLKAIPLNILPLPIYWWGVFCLTHSKSLKFLELPVPFSHLQKFSILRYPHQTKNIPTPVDDETFSTLPQEILSMRDPLRKCHLQGGGVWI